MKPRFIQCEATKDSFTCASCRQLGVEAVSSTLENQGMSGARLGVMTEEVTTQLNAVVDSTFPANFVKAEEFTEQVLCSDRRQFVLETAVSISCRRINPE